MMIDLPARGYRGRVHLGSFLRYRPLWLNYNGSKELTNFQVKCTLTNKDIAFEKLRADRQDLLFIAYDGQVISYWIESSNNTEIIIWLKFPKIIPGKENFWLYYGNRDFSGISDGDSTFELFDDFEDGIIDINKWQIDADGDPAITEEGGVLKIGGGGPIPAIRCLKTFSNYILEGTVRMTATTEYDEWFIWVAYKDDSNYYRHRHAPGHPTTDQRHNLIKNVDGATTVLDDVNYTTADADWHKFKAIVLDSGLKKIDFEDLPDLAADDTSLTSPFTFRLGGTSNTGHWVEYDYVIVRKFAEPEPFIIV